jgi:U-box domain
MTPAPSIITPPKSDKVRVAAYQDFSAMDSDGTFVLNEHGVQIPVPRGFTCPVTLELMKFPMVSRQGQVYERQAILQWIERGNGFCPLTRQPLSYSDIVPHHALRSRIECWRMSNCIPVSKRSPTLTCQEDAYNDSDDDDMCSRVAVLRVTSSHVKELAQLKRASGITSTTDISVDPCPRRSWVHQVRRLCGMRRHHSVAGAAA